MPFVLVCYATSEGQTAKVANRIAETLEARGHDVRALAVRDLPADVHVEDFDAVLVGASIHAGKHQPAIREFVEANRDALDAKPTAFFQVSLSSADEEGAAQAAGYVDELVRTTGWHPDRVGFFGGALRYSEYGFLKRFVIKQAVKRSMPDVTTDHDVEFTDWDEVEAFAGDVAAFVEGRLEENPPS